MSAPLTALKHADAVLAATIHAAADAVEQIATGSVDAALARLEVATAEAADRIRRASIARDGCLADLLGLLAGIAGPVEADLLASREAIPAPVPQIADARAKEDVQEKGEEEIDLAHPNRYPCCTDVSCVLCGGSGIAQAPSKEELAAMDVLILGEDEDRTLCDTLREETRRVERARVAVLVDAAAEQHVATAANPPVEEKYEHVRHENLETGQGELLTISAACHGLVALGDFPDIYAAKAALAGGGVHRNGSHTYQVVVRGYAMTEAEATAPAMAGPAASKAKPKRRRKT